MTLNALVFRAFNCSHTKQAVDFLHEKWATNLVVQSTKSFDRNHLIA